VKEDATLEQHPVQARESEPLGNGASDFFLFHNSADGLWTKELAERVQEAPTGNRNLRLSLTTWNSARGANALVEMGESLRGHCHMGIVVSRAMLLEDWPAAKRTIESLKELTLAKGRIVTILKENVTIPPMLRLGEWFDFRNENYFEENILDLTSFLREDLAPGGESSPQSAGLPLDSANRSASVASLYSFGVCSARERILSNLFPVVELPKFVFSAETQFQTEAELKEACGGAGPLPFLLKESRLYTIESVSQNSSFARAVASGNTAQESFTQWFSRNDRAGWALELLNNLFRNHAWKRALLWDKSTEQYFFPRTRPKNVWWEISKQTISREVIAPHIVWIDFENQVRAEAQYGWGHRSLRAGFVQVMGDVCLRLEPSWVLTELDGKTPATTKRVGPVLSGGPPPKETSGQILRSLRFWSAVLAKGHHEIRINTGQAPVRIKMTPLSGSNLFGIRGDQMEYDQLMLTEMEDDLVMPALGPLEQEIISHEEDICSEAVREIRSE
jgi:hypothetical protein